jgi:hypothetical protein
MTKITKTKETTKNGQSRYTGNNEHTIHMTRKTKTKETTKNGQSRDCPFLVVSFGFLSRLFGITRYIKFTFFYIHGKVKEM